MARGSVYANDIVATSRPFRSRFIEFSLPPYSYEEFCEIAVKLADKEMDMIGKLLLRLQIPYGINWVQLM
jgi:hypothetical protein